MNNKQKLCWEKGAIKRMAPALLFMVASSLVSLPSDSADAVCAQVKIEIKQELTLERQAFDANMRITNGLDTTSLENVNVNVSFKDEAGNGVLASSNANDTNAKFFIRIDSMSGISDVTGLGTVFPKSTADIHWGPRGHPLATPVNRHEQKPASLPHLFSCLPCLGLLCALGSRLQVAP